MLNLAKDIFDKTLDFEIHQSIIQIDIIKTAAGFLCNGNGNSSS